MEQLQQHLADLEVEVQQLKSQMNDMQSTMSTSKGAAGAAADPAHSTADSVAPGASPSQTNAVLSADDRGVLDYLKGTTINASIDGYYDWNFNRPVGRVNLLRAYDVSSNAFSLNQAAVILEHAPDVAAGRRFGARLDLQFGQATSTLQGNPNNEPRPNIYRNIFQAYGTYVVPVGSGLTVDFGKWASSLGAEGNYSQFQMNYSRAYWFNFLPFYHMGIRAEYAINKKLALNYWIVNGTNQVEPTNGFKDELFGFVLTPVKTVSWTMNYYLGQEHPDADAGCHLWSSARAARPVLREDQSCARRKAAHPRQLCDVADDAEADSATGRRLCNSASMGQRGAGRIFGSGAHRRRRRLGKVSAHAEDVYRRPWRVSV